MDLSEVRSSLGAQLTSLKLWRVVKVKIRKVFDKRLKKSVWTGDVTIRGRRFRPRADTKEEVEAILSSIRLRVRQERYDLPYEERVVTLEMLVAERLRDLDTERKKNHRTIARVLSSFRDHFPADQRVDRLTEADVLSFKRARLAASRLKANSINRELEAIAAMFNRAGAYFPSLAAWKHPRMHYEREERRERVITPGEEGALLAALRAERRPREQLLAWRTRQTVADLWELAPLVGMRRGEMRLMEKSWIDLEAGLVHLPARIVKTRRARSVPLNDEALAILRRRMAASTKSPYVFTGARGEGVLGEYQMYRAIRRAADIAGAPYGRDVEGGFTLHDARHTAVTRMLQAGHDLASVGAVVGHSKETMTLTYAHATLASQRRAVASLGRRAQSAVDKKLTTETEPKEEDEEAQ